jgi:hypothetical protein
VTFPFGDAAYLLMPGRPPLETKSIKIYGNEAAAAAGAAAEADILNIA